jgi:uncharacterized protein (TIGR02271 family)
VPAPGRSEDGAADELVLPLHAETLQVSKQRAKTRVQVSRTTVSREQVVDELLQHERVMIECVPIGRIVDAVPPVRQEGDVTVFPVVEEIVVVERRLVLKEEVRIRRVKETTRHEETVVLREQHISIARQVLPPRGHAPDS